MLRVVQIFMRIRFRDACLMSGGQEGNDEGIRYLVLGEYRESTGRYRYLYFELRTKYVCESAGTHVLRVANVLRYHDSI